MKVIYSPPRSQWQDILERPSIPYNQILPLVQKIFKRVTKDGDRALMYYTSKFDKTNVSNISVSEEESNEAIAKVSDQLKEAIYIAKSNITKFHEAQQTRALKVETTDGIFCRMEKRPIQKVGIYIPGGSAPLFSTVLMLAIPARLAGCKEVVLCTPPDKNGNIAPEILFAASLCGISHIFKVGGAQAIAAMAVGTESIPKIYKVFGPGNSYVTAAKQYATCFGVAIDMPAGPSELLILADDSAVTEFVAADLLSQAEHGADSQVILVALSKTLIDKTKTEIKRQIKLLPRRDITKKVMKNSKFVYFENIQMAVIFINEYAPEHLIIATKDTNIVSKKVENAGSVFLGNYAAESLGDYASGTNHTLPTNGFAKNYSGVGLASFQRSITFQEVTEEGIKNIGRSVEIMAEAEGLQAHKNAISIRLKKWER